MSNIANQDAADQLLAALGEQLTAVGERFELVVIGGSGLLALGLIERSTRDIDLVALRTDDGLESARPLPEPLARARDRVARDFSLPADWLNGDPTDLLRFGLPEGFIDRLEGLAVYFASRYDQIHFKLFAMVDQVSGKHEDDLRALAPSDEELLTAARWSRSQDPSEGYAQMLDQALTYLGVKRADL